MFTVVYAPPTLKQGDMVEVMGVFATEAEASEYIEQTFDPVAVNRGDYGIDGPEG